MVVGTWACCVDDEDGGGHDEDVVVVLGAGSETGTNAGEAACSC